MTKHGTVYDCIVRGGRIVDGTGTRPPFAADVGIVGDRIAAVGELSAHSARREIDARCRLVSPGFIDVHVHGELALLGGRDRYASVLQGVTTQLTSPDGFGWAPLPSARAREMFRYTRFICGEVDAVRESASVARYLAAFRGHIPINLYPQVPHCAVRLAAMAWAPRPATDCELEAIVEAAREWMEAGAGALCIGLDYQPSVHADLRELVAVSRVVRKYGGIYAAHIRKQALGNEGAWQEAFEVARQADIPVHISHERVDAETASILERADREGIDLSFDSYLYPAGMTHLALLLPPETQAGSLEDMLHRMREPGTRASSEPYLGARLASFGDPMIGYTESGRFTGMTLSQAARSAGMPREAFAYDLILQERGVETFVIPWPFGAAESAAIIRQTATHPLMMLASDGVYNIPHPHPRGYGCFAQMLRRFVRERGTLSWETAVHKMSGYPAQRFGLADRGRIAEGMAADLVVLDPATVSDRATWQHPLEQAAGVEWVLVNGDTVVENGAPTGHLAGRVLYRS